ncbi:hypothetical protein [Methanohalobium sp.]|uniref:hypothetical protein n=1 Tax=Methanohalobium sp. TaxID=2837493 RepID=UPI0025DDB42B|nr:hypothetical protein [Methanohalobium sp.]
MSELKETLENIPEDVPASALSGATLAVRAEDTDSVVEKLEKEEVMQFLRFVFDTPEEAIGESENNITTTELRHMAKVAAENIDY